MKNPNRHLCRVKDNIKYLKIKTKLANLLQSVYEDEIKTHINPNTDLI